MFVDISLYQEFNFFGRQCGNSLKTSSQSSEITWNHNPPTGVGDAVASKNCILYSVIVHTKIKKYRFFVLFLKLLRIPLHQYFPLDIIKERLLNKSAISHPCNVSSLSKERRKNKKKTGLNDKCYFFVESYIVANLSHVLLQCFNLGLWKTIFI